jgi:hypothetical protein
MGYKHIFDDIKTKQLKLYRHILPTDEPNKCSIAYHEEGEREEESEG